MRWSGTGVTLLFVAGLVGLWTTSVNSAPNGNARSSAGSPELQRPAERLRQANRRSSAPPRHYDGGGIGDFFGQIFGPGRFEFGFASGGTSLFGDDGSLNLFGRDVFGGGLIEDRRVISPPRSSPTNGVNATWYAPLPSNSPFAEGSSFFVRTGVLFPSAGDTATPFSEINPTPRGQGTVTVRDNFNVPLFAGVSVPVNPFTMPAKLQAGFGGRLINRTTMLTVTELGAAGTPPFSASQTQTIFEPGFTAGVRVAGGDIFGTGPNSILSLFTFGLDVIVTANRAGDPLILQSPNFATQSYHVKQPSGGTNKSVVFTANANPASLLRFVNNGP